MLFSTRDVCDRIIVLTPKAHAHIARYHPGVQISAIKTTVEQPDVIYMSVKDPESDVYFKLGSDITYRNLYCKVVVKFIRPEEGQISTSFYVRAIQGVDPGGLRYVSR